MQHSSRRAGLVLAALGTCAFAPEAWAQSAPSWEVLVSPYLWIAGISGTLKTPFPNAPTGSVDAGFGDVLSHLNAVPVMIAAEARHGRLAVLADFIAVSVEADVSTKNDLYPGGSVRVTQFIGTALGAYRVLEAPAQTEDLGVGVRAFALATKFTLDPPCCRACQRSPGRAGPTRSRRYHADLGPHWGITVYGDVGGGPDGEFTWQALATVDYRLSQASVLRVGHRNLQFEYGTKALDQNMRMSGPILIGTISF